MTDPQTIWGALIAAQAVVNIPFALYLLKGTAMPVSTQDATALEEIQTSIDALPAKLASVNQAAIDAAVAAATAQATQDAADTSAEIQSKADQLKSAVGA